MLIGGIPGRGSSRLCERPIRQAGGVSWGGFASPMLVRWPLQLCRLHWPPPRADSQFAPTWLGSVSPDDGAGARFGRPRQLFHNPMRIGHRVIATERLYTL